MRRRTKLGLTFAEIMTVIVLLGILLGATFILGRGTIERRRVDSTARELNGSLQMARSASVNSGGARVDLTLSGDLQWEVVTGPSPGGDVVKRFEVPSGVQINVTPSVTRVEFQQNGSLTEASVGGPGGTEVVIRVANMAGDFQRTITVSRSAGGVSFQER